MSRYDDEAEEAWQAMQAEEYERHLQAALDAGGGWRVSRLLSFEDVARWCAWAGISVVGALHRRVLDEVYWADDDGLVALEEVILSGLELMAGGCSGPLADASGGREPPAGDNDCDSHDDLMMRASRVIRCRCGGYAPPRARCFRCHYRLLPPDCDGADDNPRDCLEAM